MLFPTNCARPRALSSAAMFPLAVLCAPASIVAIWVKTLFPLPPSPVNVVDRALAEVGFVLVVDSHHFAAQLEQ